MRGHDNSSSNRRGDLLRPSGMHIFDHSFFAMAPVILPRTLHFSNSFLRGSCTIICRSEGMCSHLPLAAVTAVPVAARSVAVSSLRIAIYPAPTWHVAHSVFNIHITYVVLPFFYQIYEIRASHCEERNDSKCPSSSFVFCFPPVLLLLSFPHLFCASHVLMCYYSYVIGFFKNFTLNHYCASSG